MYRTLRKKKLNRQATVSGTGNTVTDTKDTLQWGPRRRGRCASREETEVLREWQRENVDRGGRTDGRVLKSKSVHSVYSFMLKVNHLCI